MGLFDKLFGHRPKEKGAMSTFRLLNGYTPVFTTRSGELYEDELIRAAIAARATHISKLQVITRGAAKPALQRKLALGPNELQTWSQFLRRLSTILDVHNTAFITPVYDVYGEASGIYTVLPNRCEIAQADGTLASGLTQIGKHLYFFKAKSHKMIRDKKKKVNGTYYYFQKNGRAARNKWVKIKSKYYYFLEDGTMAVNQFIGSTWFVGPDGARTKKTMKAGGVTKLNGKYYLYDKSGALVTNKWVTIGSKTYYAGADGAALIGLQKINSKKYYFNKRGVLQKDTVVTIGGTVYVIGSDGRITGTAQYSGEAIAEYGKKFKGNPYVYGGISLTNGADCSGFVYSIMLKFGIKVLRTADQQMKGPSSALQKQGYKKGTVVKDSNLKPGDLVFYGNSSYASHVAIYIGDGQVVHAANSRVGIIISGIDYCSGRVKNHNMRYWA